MNDYELHELVMSQVCREISTIAEQMKKSGTMSSQDLERLDKLYHLKKDLLATHGMEHPEEYEQGLSGDNMSGVRGRSPMTGRYVSREGNSYAQGYNSGYSQGYSQAMNNNSGNWSQGMYPYPERKW